MQYYPRPISREAKSVGFTCLTSIPLPDHTQHTFRQRRYRQELGDSSFHGRQVITNSERELRPESFRMSGVLSGSVLVPTPS